MGTVTLASSDFRHLLITFANSLDPDQDGQTVGPDLDSNHLTLIIFLKNVVVFYLTHKAPITTAAEDKFSDIFPYFGKKRHDIS